MPWVDGGSGQWVWNQSEYDTGAIPPMPGSPPPSAGRDGAAAVPATSPATSSGAPRTGLAAGLAGTVSAVSGASQEYQRARGLRGQEVPNRPGYVYQISSDGRLVERPLASTATAQQYGRDVQQGPAPTAPAPITVDPATGQPISGGAPGPRQPAPGSSLAANYASQHRTPQQRTGEVAQAPAAAQPAAQPAATGAGSADFVSRDYSPQQQAISRLQQTEADFYSQLDRLRGVDPFGNQAAIRQGTDRAVSQAAGTAAGTRGGAAALAGAQNRAVGVQSQLAARATGDIAAQRRADEVQAAQLGIQTVGGIGQIRGQIVGAQAQIADQMLADAELNLRSYLGGRELDQRERDSLRNLATQIAQIDQQRYATDVGYRQSVDDNVTRLLLGDKQLEGIAKQIEAGGEITGKDWFMGLMGLAEGVAQGAATKSDRRAKTGFTPAKTKDLKEFLGSGRGEFYEYREPHSTGARPGPNFGGMAQDLQKSKIGRTVVIEKKDGLYVDTGRLALATHGVLGHLAKRLERLERKVRR